MKIASIAKSIEKEIKDWTNLLINIGITQKSRVYFPDNKGNMVTFKNSNLLSSVSNLCSYCDIYKLYLEEKIYNILTIDRAIIQIEYRFESKQFIYHRLAFFPAPSLELPWNTFEIKLPDLESELQQVDSMLPLLYKDITEQKVVRFPLRFDYYNKSQTDTDPFHPKVHLTLGEYSKCRIPVITPLTPSIFFHFILQNFYHRTFRNLLKNGNKIPKSNPKLFKIFTQILPNITYPQNWLYIDTNKKGGKKFN